ncbi:MAG: murein biosynthesis integral membrane protein MurJ [Pseudolabrys sp.]
MALARKLATVGGGTLMSRLLAYARDAGIAALLGAGVFAEAFFAMLQVINFFRRLLAEGALNGAFVPIWLKLRGGENGAAAANRFTLRALLIMLGVGGAVWTATALFAWFVIGIVAPGFDGDRRAFASFLLLLASPYILFCALAAILAAALNAAGRVNAVAVSTVLFNTVMVAAVASAFASEMALAQITMTLALAVAAAGLVQVLVVAMAWLVFAAPWRGLRARIPGQTAAFFRRALPGLIASGVPQLKLIAATAIVSGSPAAVAWLYYANRLYELPLGVASVAIATVIVPRIAESLRAEQAAFAAAQSRAYEIALGLALPAAAGFAVLASPIASALFERGAFTGDDTAAVAAALIAICAGLPGHALDKVLGAVSFAHEDTRTPMLTALAGLAVAIAGGIALYGAFGFVGAAAAIALSAWIGAGLLGTILYRRGWLGLDMEARRRLPLIVLAAAIMAVAVALALTALPAAGSTAGRLALVGALVALGVAVYAAALHLTGVFRLKQLASALRRAP